MEQNKQEEEKKQSNVEQEQQQQQQQQEDEAFEPNLKSLGDRMKEYEFATRSYIDNKLPFIVRLDGHGFSKFTKGLKRPYEKWFHDNMVKTTAVLVHEYSAALGYTQSDEITLVYFPKLKKDSETEYQDYMFGNQIQKWCSLLAGAATNTFTNEIRTLVQTNVIRQEDYNENTYKKLVYPRCYFDARMFNVPNKMEVQNNLMWRSSHDCVRNSISMTAFAHFSTKQLHGLNGQQKIDLLKKEKQIDWEQLDPHFKYGTFIKKRNYSVQVQVPEQFKNKKQNQNQDQDEENKEVHNETALRKKLVGFCLYFKDLDYQQIQKLLFEDSLDEQQPKQLGEYELLEKTN